VRVGINKLDVCGRARRWDQDGVARVQAQSGIAPEGRKPCCVLEEDMPLSARSEVQATLPGMIVAGKMGERMPCQPQVDFKRDYTSFAGRGEPVGVVAVERKPILDSVRSR
jgi:hypothetical protein